MNKAPAKLTLKISLNDDMRRVTHTGALNFETLIATVKKLFNTLTEDEVKTLIVRYQDDEKDWITVSSDEELSEAISLLPTETPVLRLTLTLNQPKQRHCGGGGRWRRMMMAAAQNGVPLPEGGEQRHEGWKRWWGAHGGCPQPQSAEGGEQRHEGWKRWWGAQGGCPRPQSAEGGEQKHEGGKRCGGGRGRFFFLQKQGLRLMETGQQANIQAAKVLFQEQLAIFEHHTPIYNISCCEALLGNTKEALVFLKRAVDAGFRDVNHIENDADLKSLRHLDEYKTIIASIAKPATSSNSSNTSPAPATPVVVVPEVKPAETPKPEVKAPEISVPTPSAPAIPSAHEASLAALENMGFKDRARNVEALERAKGDIVVAVQLLVDSQRLYKWF